MSVPVAERRGNEYARKIDNESPNARGTPSASRVDGTLFKYNFNRSFYPRGNVRPDRASRLELSNFPRENLMHLLPREF